MCLCMRVCVCVCVCVCAYSVGRKNAQKAFSQETLAIDAGVFYFSSS